MDEKAPMTMKDIAREFGISVATVSRALKDSPRISEERRKAIQQYAREHNFFPNAIGEALRHSRVMPQRIIGVIVPEFTHYYFSSILTGIEEAAAARGYRIMVALSGEQYEREARICENFHRYKVCGVIVSQAKDTKNYDHYQKLLDAGIPMVFYDRICTPKNPKLRFHNFQKERSGFCFIYFSVKFYQIYTYRVVPRMIRRVRTTRFSTFSIGASPSTLSIKISAASSPTR